MATTTAPTTSSGIAAGIAQPQTTIEPFEPGNPFIRHSQTGRRTQYVVSGIAFGTGQISQPLVQAPGYARAFRLQFNSISTGATTTAAFQTDGPFNLASSVLLKDAYGTQLYNGTGYEMLYLVPKYGGGFGLWTSADPRSLPSFQNVVAATAAWSFSTALPLEFALGCGVISMANGSLLPNLQMNINAAATVMSGTLTNVPTLTVTNDLDFWWLPEGVDIAPPELGTTCQWNAQVCNPQIGSGSTQKVQAPRLGGYIESMILEARDSTNARQDAWPGLTAAGALQIGARFRIYIDGVLVVDSLVATLYDDMAIQFQYPLGGQPSAQLGAAGFTAGTATPALYNTQRDTGILVINRKMSLSQVMFGLLDSGEIFLSTNPGTQLEFGDGPWGTVGTPPYTLTLTPGQVVPVGTIIQGLPSL
jgi:hypothetical protein